MRFAWVLVLSACGEHERTVHLTDASELRELDLHVLSGPDRVVLYARETNRPCICTVGEFPALGGCVGESDAIACQCTPSPASCIDRVAVESEGAVLVEQPFFSGPELVLFIPNLVTRPAPVLVIDGCGAHAEIPIGGRGPTPMFTFARTSDDRLHVDWTTDRPAASTIAELNDMFAGEECHAAGMTVDFPGIPIRPGGIYSVGVLALDPPVASPTPFGDAAVFSAGITFQSGIMFP